MADTTLADAVTDFLASSATADWTRTPLAGDASGRRYERLAGPGGRTVILMDARAEPASLAPFLRIGRHLRALGLRPPEVLADGPGLLLLEDLGSRTMAAWLEERPGDAPLLYRAAIDLIVRLQAAAPPSDLAALTPERAAGMILPLWEHYAPATSPRLIADVTSRLHEALERHAPEATVLSLRDYHAENLIWRPDREGADRLGLLDFQDAVLAPPEYDLASLLRDARRDTDPKLRAAMIRHFAEATGRDEARTAAAAAVLGVQRNLRILGIFARLARERGKLGYLCLLPRVHAHILDDLAHPALTPLADLVRATIPAPGSLA